MKFRLIPLNLLAIVLFSSCQKELTNEGLPSYCNVSGITIKNGTGNVTASYQFTYDSLLRRASILQFEDFLSGTSRTIYPTYKQDTIFLGLNSFLTIDGSKRIKTLAEFNGTQGVLNGDYYFSYNSDGQLSERLIDDGVNNSIRTNYTFANGNLTSFIEDLPGIPQSISGNLTFAGSPPITAYSHYGLLELFPELLLYMPVIQIGKVPVSPLSDLKADINIPGFPLTSVNTTYSNYTLTPEGWLASFDTKTETPGVPAIITKYQFQYRCYN